VTHQHPRTLRGSAQLDQPTRWEDNQTGEKANEGLATNPAASGTNRYT
jgi:hypothetical protein